MTITEKILARACGWESVSPGEIVTCEIDLICIDEIQLPIFKETLKKIGDPPLQKERCVFVIDHFCPPTSLDQARNTRMVRDFAKSLGL